MFFFLLLLSFLYQQACNYGTQDCRDKLLEQKRKDAALEKMFDDTTEEEEEEVEGATIASPAASGNTEEEAAVASPANEDEWVNVAPGAEEDENLVPFEPFQLCYVHRPRYSRVSELRNSLCFFLTTMWDLLFVCINLAGFREHYMLRHIHFLKNLSVQSCSKYF